MQSGAHMYNKDRPVVGKGEALQSAKQIAKQLNCKNDNQWLQCLRTVDAKQLVQFATFYTFPIEGTDFLPFPVLKAFNEKHFNKGLSLK